MSRFPTLVLFTRYPEPGACKTRLIPAIGPERAAEVHRRLTEKTVAILRQSGAPVAIATTGATKPEFEGWLGSGVEYVAQSEGDLTARLVPFVERAPVVFFGSDTPSLTGKVVKAAIDGLRSHRVVIGPAEDGGYYLIAMREPMPELFIDMPWSTEQVMPETLGRLGKFEIQPLLLPTLSDCDRPEDLAKWPELTA